MGVVVLALVGTAADLFAAVVFARQDKMDIVFAMCVAGFYAIAFAIGILFNLVHLALIGSLVWRPLAHQRGPCLRRWMTSGAKCALTWYGDAQRRLNAAMGPGFAGDDQIK
jgi:hypothetical protein